MWPSCRRSSRPCAGWRRDRRRPPGSRPARARYDQSTSSLHCQNSSSKTPTFCERLAADDAAVADDPVDVLRAARGTSRSGAKRPIVFTSIGPQVTLPVLCPTCSRDSPSGGSWPRRWRSADPLHHADQLVQAPRAGPWCRCSRGRRSRSRARAPWRSPTLLPRQKPRFSPFSISVAQGKSRRTTGTVPSSEPLSSTITS